METMANPPDEGSMLLQRLLEPIASPVPPGTPAHQNQEPGFGPETINVSPNAKYSNEDRPWVCEQCGFPFKYKNNLAEHMRFYHMKGSVPCSKCSEVFPTSNHLRRHRKVHAAEQGRCPHCRTVFPNTEHNPTLYNELYQKHLPTCRRCPTKKSKKKHGATEFKNSTQMEHTSKLFKTYKENDTYVLCCLVCSRKFTDLVDYETHRCGKKRLSLDDNKMIDAKDTNSVQQFLTYEPLSTPSATSQVDYNCLCVICGVNFENEDKLNLHLYENHQNCDQDTLSQNLQPTPKICTVNFSQSFSLERQKAQDQMRTDKKDTKSKDTAITEETSEAAKCDEMTGVDDMVLCWLCKFCKQIVSSESEIPNHMKHCNKKPVSVQNSPDKPNTQNLNCNLNASSLVTASSVSSLLLPNKTAKMSNLAKQDSVVNLTLQGSKPHQNTTSDLKVIQNKITSSNTSHNASSFAREEVPIFRITDSTLPILKDAPEVFCSDNYKNRKSKDQHCNNEEHPDSDSIVQWICKYCKNPFPTLTEMRAHKELCALEHQRRRVLVRWVCRYCKLDFHSREAMNSHKKLCSLRRKDKSVICSKKSEVVSKESNLKAKMNSPGKVDCQAEISVLDLNIVKLENNERVVSLCSDDNTDETATMKYAQNTSYNHNTIMCLDITSENEVTKQETFVHDYMFNEIQPKSKNLIPNHSNGVELLSVPDEPDIIVKWVCRYCKSDFDEREEMTAHKRNCVLKPQRRIHACITEPQENQLIPNGMSPTKVSTDGTEKVKSTPLSTDSNLNTSEQGHNAQPKIKLKIKLPHACNKCGKKFAVRKLMKSHRLEAHMLKCSRCGRYFRNNTLLWKHSRLCRAQKAPPENQKRVVYTCKQCYRVFRVKYKYKLHKGACQHQKLDQEKLNSTISLPNEKALLRIHCHQCSGFYLSGEITRLHTCEKPRDVDVFLCCSVCNMSFLTVSSFCQHSLGCALNLPGVTQDSIPSKIVCHSCLRQFNSIYFFYQHLITGTCSNDFFKAYVDSTDILEGSTQANDEYHGSSHSADSESDDEDGRDWTCTFCKFIFPSSIPKVTHYQMCRKKDSIKSMTKIKHRKKTSKKVMRMSLPAVKVVLHRLPDSILPQELKPNTPELESEQIVLNLKQTSVQRCVFCYKRCRFAGTGLPPIGQLECFRCRNKNHRKELKKQGERFYCRSVIDEEPKPVEQNGENIYSNGYLDPSKRLKISRAMSKAKHSNQDDFSGENVVMVPVVPHTVKRTVVPPKVVQKCAHCKRGFASKELLQKHIKLSKTCLQAEKTRVFTSEEAELSADHRSSIINFMEFFSRVSNENVSVNSNTSSPTCMEIDDHSLTDYELSISDQSQISTGYERNSEDTSTISEVGSSQPITRTSYLVLENVDRALKSCSLTKLVPSSPALQCDGWILRSSSQTENGSDKMKLICGACYKSFPNDNTFSEHVSTVHNLSVDTKLNPMKHIPAELLNKITW